MATKAQLQDQCTGLENENRELSRLLARAERELNNKLLDEELPPEKIPYRVTCLMKYHSMPWEVFWCSDELDSSFPHSMTDNSCPVCRGEENQ